MKNGFRPIFNTLVFITAITCFALFVARHDGQRMADRARYSQFLRQAARHYAKPDISVADSQPEADSPELAALQDYFATLDPALQRVPAERLASAYGSLQKMASSTSKNMLSAIRWTGTDADMGGRTRAIMWDPQVRGKVWAGGVTGGLWFNNNINSPDSAWHPVNDMWDNLAISCIMSDPNHPDVMYVGTGEAPTALITYRESGGRGVGIWKTTDGGAHWQLLSSTSGFSYVTKIAIHTENNQSVVYAGVVSGYYHGPQLNTPSDGLFRSADGGKSWQQVLPDIPGTKMPYGVSDVVTGADDRLYVGTMQNIDGNGGGVILFSDDGSTGTWTVFDDVANLIPGTAYLNLPGRVVLAPAPSDANIIYAAFAAGVKDPGAQPVYRGLFIFKSTDRGQTWTDISLPGGDDNWANLAWHAMTMAVDPQHPDVLFAGGLDVWKSADGGSSWVHLSDWSKMYDGGGDQYVHADQHTMVYKPGSSSDLLFGSDGGVFYTRNASDVIPVFTQKNKGYNTLQFYTCAMHPGAGRAEYIGGLQDNGSLYYHGKPLNINDMISGGDGAACFWDENDTGVMLTSVYYNRYYVFNQGNLYNYIDEYSGVFVNPADYNSKSNTLYANGSDFWGGNADKILRVSGIPQNGAGYLVNAGTGVNEYFSCVRVSPSSTATSTRLFVGTVSGRLFRIDNAQSTLVAHEIGSRNFPAGNLSCIAPGGSEDTLLVTFSNYGVSSVWLTFDGGATWKEQEGNLPDMPVRWALIHPANHRQAMLATELGVWVTGNLGSDDVKWFPQNDGMANVRVDMLTMRTADNTVLAATHGRGLFTCIYDKDIFTKTLPQIDAASSLKVWAANGAIQVSGYLPQSSFRLYNLGGSLLQSGKTGSGNQLTLSAGNLSKGVYLLVTGDGNTRQTVKFVL